MAVVSRRKIAAAASEWLLMEFEAALRNLTHSNGSNYTFDPVHKVHACTDPTNLARDDADS
jgi:hypothetical protein